MSSWRVEGDVSAFESGENRIVGEVEQKGSLLWRELTR